MRSSRNSCPADPCRPDFPVGSVDQARAGREAQSDARSLGAVLDVLDRAEPNVLTGDEVVAGALQIVRLVI